VCWHFACDSLSACFAVFNLLCLCANILFRFSASHFVHVCMCVCVCVCICVCVCCCTCVFILILCKSPLSVFCPARHLVTSVKKSLSCVSLTLNFLCDLFCCCYSCCCCWGCSVQLAPGAKLLFALLFWLTACQNSAVATVASPFPPFPSPFIPSTVCLLKLNCTFERIQPKPKCKSDNGGYLCQATPAATALNCLAL